MAYCACAKEAGALQYAHSVQVNMTDSNPGSETETEDEDAAYWQERKLEYLGGQETTDTHQNIQVYTRIKFTVRILYKQHAGCSTLSKSGSWTP
jgi:hypothetical protein